MRFARVTGRLVCVTCKGCGARKQAGDQPLQHPTRPEFVEHCDLVYADLDGPQFDAYYCSDCAAKLVQEDPTRAVNQFWSDTEGRDIEPKVFESGDF